MNIILPAGARLNCKPVWRHLFFCQYPAPFQITCAVPHTQGSLSCSFFRAGFPVDWKYSQMGESVFAGWGGKASFLLPLPLLCSHYMPDILLPEYRLQRMDLKDPFFLCSSRNCLWHCLSSVIIQLCPVTSSCPNSCYQSGTREREVRGMEERWSHYRADRAVRMEPGDGLAITWPECKHTSYWIDLSLRVMDLLVHHFCYIAGHSTEIVSGN